MNEATDLLRNCPEAADGGVWGAELCSAEEGSLRVLAWADGVQEPGRLPWVAVETREISGSTKMTKEGGYEHTVEIVLSGRVRRYGRRLDWMAQAERFVVRLTDAGGNQTIYGSQESPLKLTWEEVQTGTPGRNEYRLTLSGVCREPARGSEVAEVVDLLG